MSIQKESDGVPEVNPHLRTTKVNFSIIFAVLLFFAISAGVALWVARRTAPPVGAATAPVTIP